MPEPTTPTEPQSPDPAEQPVLPEQPTSPDPPTPTERSQPPEQAEQAERAADGGPRKDVPEYKGEPLDAERGPGLGCFWIQIGLLTFFLIFTPLTVTWGWNPTISAALLIFTLILLLFSGQTIIFLLRLVAADRRTRRTPLAPGAKPTVGQMEDAPVAPEESAPVAPDAEASTEPSDDREAAPEPTPDTEADDD